MTALTPVLSIRLPEARVPTFSAFLSGVLKKSSPRCFRCLTASPGRAVRSWSWRGTSMVRGLISECSYPWAVEPAGLNGSIRHQLSGEGSGGELERCLRWGSSWSDRRRHRRKTDACQVRNFKTASNIKWDCLRSVPDGRDSGVWAA
jgi:hypothetical protein